MSQIFKIELHTYITKSKIPKWQQKSSQKKKKF